MSTRSEEQSSGSTHDEHVLERKLAAAEARLARSDTDHAEFIARVAHALRTPLSPIVAALQMLEAEPLGERARRCVELIARNLGQQTRLIDDLADVVRLRRQKLDLELTELDGAELLVRVRDAHASTASRRGVTVTTEGGAGLTLRADAARLTQALGHLLANALRFSTEGGVVELRAETAGPHARFTIIDHGRGLSQDELVAVREGRPAGTASGIGVGLTLARGILEAHGGSLKLESPGVGQGARAIAELPMGREQPQATPGARPQGPVRVLLVDDHEDSLTLTRMMLERRGYSVVTARSVTEALACGAQQVFDVLVSDIGLPDDSGLAILPELTKLGPVLGIAVSGFGRDSDIAQSKAAGYVEHLTKPVNLQRLHDLIQRHLGVTP